MYRSILRNILPSTSVLPSLKLGQYFLFRAKYFSVLTSTSVNINIILTLVSVHTEKYCPKQKKYCPSFSEGNTLLLRAIFQVWTDTSVNILFIASLPCKTRLFLLVYLLVTSQRAIPLSIARQSTNQIARKAVLHG